MFISYAREDQSWADRLYMDLRRNEVDAWLDVRCVGAGADWSLEVRKAIQRSGFFILLLSKHSVTKRGYVQREIKLALDVMKEFPTGATYLIPVKLDATEPNEEELRRLNWVDLLPNYAQGFSRILSSLSGIDRTPLSIYTGSVKAPTVPGSAIDRGKEIGVIDLLVLGPRASISYAPFRSKKEYLEQFFDRLPTDDMFGDHAFSFYITFDTRHPKAIMPDELKATYPEQITIVLQRVFSDLEVRTDGFTVSLKFSGQSCVLGVPYDAIREIDLPELGVKITLSSVE